MKSKHMFLLWGIPRIIVSVSSRSLNTARLNTELYIIRTKENRQRAKTRKYNKKQSTGITEGWTCQEKWTQVETGKNKQANQWETQNR